MTEPSALVALARELVQDPAFWSDLDGQLERRGVVLDTDERRALEQVAGRLDTADSREREAWTSASRGPREGC